ncbi:hypothetical protein B0H19DRAFT_1085753 [Mycena capillaripes]|nr:hypothetical protein B0H19DRAFT_1085753 [Mycena capillaripes]
MLVGLATIPLDTQLEILGQIPDFHSLSSCILISRSFSQLFTAHRPSLTRSVAQNHFGDLLEEALVLANTQMKQRYSGTKDHNYNSSFIRRLLSNEDVLERVEPIVFRFIVNGFGGRTHAVSETTYDIGVWSNSAFNSPKPTELFRLRRAAYRFWTFCMGERAERKFVFLRSTVSLNPSQREPRWFLSKFPPIELAEIANMYDGVEAWVTKMYREDYCESDYGERISYLWDLFLEMLEDPENDGKLFRESLGISGDRNEEGFFGDEFYDCWERYQHIDIDGNQAILEKGHARLKKAMEQEKPPRE